MPLLPLEVSQFMQNFFNFNTLLFSFFVSQTYASLYAQQEGLKGRIGTYDFVLKAQLPTRQDDLHSFPKSYRRVCTWPSSPRSLRTGDFGGMTSSSCGCKQKLKPQVGELRCFPANALDMTTVPRQFETVLLYCEFVNKQRTLKVFHS